MKNYKRLTERRGGLIIDNCGICPNVNNKQGCTDKKCYEIMKNRLADLEDKIESGELCDREEVRKETARTCIILAKQYQNGKKIVRDIAEKYDIDLEVEE